MKIVDVAEFYAEQGGGVKTYIRQKLRSGKELGAEVVVLAPGPTNREESVEGGRILWVASRQHPLDRRYFVFSQAEPIFELLNQEKPDVVEASSPWRGGRIVAAWTGKAARSFIFHQDPVAVYGETFLSLLSPPIGSIGWLNPGGDIFVGYAIHSTAPLPRGPGWLIVWHAMASRTGLPYLLVFCSPAFTPTSDPSHFERSCFVVQASLQMDSYSSALGGTIRRSACRC